MNWSNALKRYLMVTIYILLRFLCIGSRTYNPQNHDHKIPSTINHLPIYTNLHPQPSKLSDNNILHPSTPNSCDKPYPALPPTTKRPNAFTCTTCALERHLDLTDSGRFNPQIYEFYNYSSSHFKYKVVQGKYSTTEFQNFTNYAPSLLLMRVLVLYYFAWTSVWN